MWLNNRRVTEIYDNHLPTIESNDLSGTKLEDKISVLLTTWRNSKALMAAIGHYRFALEPIIAKIYISWNPGHDLPPLDVKRLRLLSGASHIEIIANPLENVNNVWSPII